MKIAMRYEVTLDIYDLDDLDFAKRRLTGVVLKMLWKLVDCGTYKVTSLVVDELAS